MFTSIQVVVSSHLQCFDNETRRRVLCVLATSTVPVLVFFECYDAATLERVCSPTELSRSPVRRSVARL